MFKLKKEKPLSCGIIVADRNNNILIVRPTNGSYYQIPKGLMDNKKDLSYWRAAKRELKEETGIDIYKHLIYDLDVLGYFPYRKDKDLFLFQLTLYKLPDINELHCESTFYNKVKKVEEPEVDDYKVINIKDYDRWLNKSLVKVFDKIYKG